MTREEAIQVLNTYDVNFDEYTAEEIADAFDMAIEALQADAVSREEYEELYRKAKEVNEMANDILADFPSYKEFVSVVRCKECKNWRESHSEDEESYCYIDGRTTDSTGYCSWGERREP